MRTVTTRSVLCVALLAVVLGVTGPAAAGYIEEVLASDPLLYWRLGESDTSAGQTAVNSATTGSGLGTAGNGVYGAAVASVPGAIYLGGDSAGYFGTTTASGTTGDYVKLNPFPGTSFPGTQFTAEMWVRGDTPAASWQSLLSYELSGGINRIILAKSGSSFYAYINGTSKLTGLNANNLFDGKWNHLALTWQSSDGKLKTYLNGTLAATTTHAASATIPQGGSFMLAQEQDSPGGGFQDSQKYLGALDEVALYGSVLSGTQVLDHYRAAWEKKVVAGNIAVSTTGSTWTVTETGRAAMTITSPPNLGDAEVGLLGKALLWRDGVMMATVRENGRGGKYATVEAARDSWTPPTLGINTDRADGGTETEMDINVAAAFFPFAGYWTGGHVNSSGTLVAANGISQDMLTHDATYAGKYTLKIPGVNSWNDGMLFTVGGSNADRVVGTYILSDGSGWRINVQDNDGDYGNTVQDDFSFLYMPYWATNLIGGMINANGDKMQYVGDFDLSRTAGGTYRLTIPGKSPDTGMLLLTVADEVSWAASDLPQDNVLSYQADGSNNFIIHASDLPACGRQDTRFVFAYIDFEDPPVLPEPATLTLLALGALGMVIRRRRSR